MSEKDRGRMHDNEDILLRRQIVASFHDTNVHPGLDNIFSGVPAELRGVKPGGQPFTLWRLLEHIRLCVLDFLDYCRVPDYVELPFPDGYWPVVDAPPNDVAWEESLTATRRDMAELEALILNTSTDLFAPIPNSDGRTILRQALACLDHNAYHLGQAMLLRRLLNLSNS